MAPNFIQLDPFSWFQFLPAGNATPDSNNSLHIQNYQVHGGTPPFVAHITLQPGSAQFDLSFLRFFDKNAKEIPLAADKESASIESDDGGVFDFYITANTSGDSWTRAALTFRVDTSTMSMPILLIGDYLDLPVDQLLLQPQLAGLDNGGYRIAPGRPVEVMLPPQPRNLKNDDLLFLVINQVILQQTGRRYGHDNPDQPFFYFSPDKLHFSSEGEKNTMSYIAVPVSGRPIKSPPVDFTAFG